MVELRFDPRDLLSCNHTKVGALWQVPADEALDVFDGPPFPGGVGMAEEAGETDGLGDVLMGSVFRSVVQGEGLTSPGWKGS